ncbi:MAG: AMP-binding protein, partial [bacterium]|nr:AMP-binding protein [bacterium]
PVLKGEEIALHQYTSGSTGTPKGVVLTNADLLANIRSMGRATNVTSSDTFVSWLPLYHDMGLIGAWLGSLYFAMPLVLMSPLSFLVRPERWLWAIHRHGATISAAPNFAYELCLTKIDDRVLEGLDLKSLRLATNGAEPVSPETISRFVQRYAKYGFSPEAMSPVYGLAECAVGLAFPPLGRGPKIDVIKRDALIRSGRALVAGETDSDPLRIVSCGLPLPGYQVRIVDEKGREVGDRTVGRLEFKGPSTTSGYFRNPEESNRLFHGDWLRSGDRAYMADGEIYLTGRDKDTIIRAGRNLYPYELEEAVGNLKGIRKGCVAVFGTIDPGSATEQLIVLAEIRDRDGPSLDRLRDKIEELSIDLLGTPPEDIVFAPPHTVLKTSSGKIRRSACRELYESGQTITEERAVWRQVLRVAGAAVIPQLRRLRENGGALLYAGYAWTLFFTFAAIAWVVLFLVTGITSRRAFLHHWAGILIKMSRTPLAVRGLENLPAGDPVVVVANHSSYLDSLILTAVLPPQFGFVAKRELLNRFVSRTALRQIGTLFVERFDKSRGLADSQAALQALRKGASLIFFPEGTLVRMSGLLPFYMGAFVAAAETETPVVPVTIRGTRSMLRGGQWFPRKGTVQVTVGKPIQTERSDWSGALALRNRAREEILARCGEPDLTDQDHPRLEKP